MPSVVAAAMNTAEASNSFSPFWLLKWLLEIIQISRGMLAMRISVMELGRFTLLGGSRDRPEDELIILLGSGERNVTEGPGVLTTFHHGNLRPLDVIPNAPKAGEGPYVDFRYNCG